MTNDQDKEVVKFMTTVDLVLFIGTVFFMIFVDKLAIPSALLFIGCQIFFGMCVIADSIEKGNKNDNK